MDNISKIKERLSVVDVISGYIKVQKAGANFKARCPFHNEKTPSFYISPERQIWHCFGCQKGGDIFGFVKEMEGVEFPEALRILAQRAGVKLERFDPALQDAKAVLYEICETASRFFEKQLYQSPVGKKALTYLRDRGLSENTIKEFRLGFAPDGWHNLSHFLRDCGYKDKDVVDSGLALKKEDGSDMYDRFRSRIIFTIANINDQLVGFTGRVFDVDVKHPASHQPSAISHQHSAANSRQPEAAIVKYINTPQTAVYDKSRILYGLNKAKIEARRLDRCLLVEGNMDAIMSYQAGVKNVAATSGTALTPSHLQLLRRYTNNLDFCFDTDQAGLVATRRGLGLALSQNLNVKIVHLNDPDCKDPADYIKKFGQNPPAAKASWLELASSAKPVLDFYFDKLKSELDLTTVEGKKAIISSLGPLVIRLVSQVEKSHWVSKLAAVLKTKEEAIEADIVAVKDDLDVYVDEKAKVEQTGRPSAGTLTGDFLVEALLAVVFKKPELFKEEMEEINPELFNAETALVIARLKGADLGNFKLDDFLKEFDDEARLKFEFAYLKSGELLKDFSDDDLKSEFRSIKNKLEHRSVTAQLASLGVDIKAAETVKDKNNLDILLAKFNNLTKKLIKPS